MDLGKIVGYSKYKCLGPTTIKAFVPINLYSFTSLLHMHMHMDESETTISMNVQLY
jgi:hypothetical protein